MGNAGFISSTVGGLLDLYEGFLGYSVEIKRCFRGEDLDIRGIGFCRAVPNLLKPRSGEDQKDSAL